MKYLTIIDQGLFSIFNFTLIWLAYTKLPLEQAAMLGFVLAIYSFFSTLLNSFVSTPLLYLKNIQAIPNIYPVSILTTILTGVIIVGNNSAILYLIIPIWCIRDLIRVFCIYIDRTILRISNILAISISLLVLVTTDIRNDSYLSLIILTTAPVIISAITLNLVVIKKINFIEFTKLHMSYGTVNSIELTLSGLIYQAPTMLIYQLGMLETSLALSKIMQILNIPNAILRITGLLLSKRYRTDKHQQIPHSIFLKSGLVSFSLCAVTLCVFYPNNGSLTNVEYYSSAGIIFLGYIFIFLSKPSEWRYRTMPQKYRRVYHVVFSAIFSCLLSLIILRVTSSCIAASLYFALNYFLQYVSFYSIASGSHRAQK